MKALKLFLFCIFPLLAKSQDIDFFNDVGSLYHDLNYNTYYSGHELYVDNKNSIYITGTFQGQESIWSPDPNPEYLAKVQANNYFIQKIDDNGEAVWHKLIYSGDLFAIEDQVGFNNTHRLNNIYVDAFENVYAGGSFKNQVEIDGVFSTLDTTFSNNLYLVKVDEDGELKYVLHGLSITQENGGSDLLDIASFDSDDIFLSVNIKDSLIVNIANADSLIEAQTIIFGSDFLTNTSTECAIMKLEAGNGEVLNHKVFKSTTGNGVVRAKIAFRENGNLILMGYTSKSLVYDSDTYFNSSTDEQIFISEMNSSLDDPPIYVDFGKLYNGRIFYIDELKEVQDDVFMFYGFFRGDSIEIYNSSIVGNPENLNSFIGLVDLEDKSCSLINLSNMNEPNFRSKIKISSDEEFIYALGQFKEGEVIVNDTIITIDEDEPENLILVKMGLDDLEVQNITRFPECSGAVGVHVKDNSILLAADYSSTYTLKDETIEANTGVSDIWFSRFADISTSQNSSMRINHNVYPNPTSSVLNFEGFNFDRVTIKSIDGRPLLDIKNEIRSINISFLPPQVYVISFYKSGELLFHERIVISK